MIRRYLPKTTEELIHWYERWISPVGLLIGFLLDNFVLLKRVDAVFGNVLLLTYLVLAGILIVLLNVVESNRVQNKTILWLAPFLPVMIQFCFGALFSGYLSLYSGSAGVAVSWLFVLVLAALLLGNERFRTLYEKLSFQISIYFVTLYSFFVFFLPLIFKTIGPMMFLLSGLVSVIVIALVWGLLHVLAPERVDEARPATLKSFVALAIMFNVLYFSNLIPPLPLAIKEGGVYHSIEHAEDSYVLQGESASWPVRYLSVPAKIHLIQGESAFVFTAVFAPSGLSTVLRHEWQWYDTGAHTWVTKSDVRFGILGGRDGGYRGYSEKENPEPGSWRVNVLTEHGQILTRVSFVVVQVTDEPMMIRSTK